jgi:hypothetical protein
MGNTAHMTMHAGQHAPSRLNLSNGLTLFAAGIAVIFLVLSAIANYRTTSPSIGSADYQRIVEGKDLVADILPPTSYVVEAYLTIIQASQEPWNRDAHFKVYREHKDAISSSSSAGRRPIFLTVCAS